MKQMKYIDKVEITVCRSCWNKLSASQLQITHLQYCQ